MTVRSWSAARFTRVVLIALVIGGFAALGSTALGGSTAGTGSTARSAKSALISPARCKRNQAAGTIWDTIEFDKAVGVARAWAAKRPTKDTLILVTADHDQSMSIIGVSNVPDTEYFNRTRSEKVAIKTTLGKNGSTVR